MRSFGSASSMRIARIASRALRSHGAVGADQHVLGDLLGDGRGAAHAPAVPYCSMLVTTARRMPSGSTPWCSQKRWSSALTKAAWTRLGMASIGMKTRRSAASSASSRLSAA